MHKVWAVLGAVHTFTISYQPFSVPLPVLREHDAQWWGTCERSPQNSIIQSPQQVDLHMGTFICAAFRTRQLFLFLTGDSTDAFQVGCYGPGGQLSSLLAAGMAASCSLTCQACRTCTQSHSGDSRLGTELQQMKQLGPHHQALRGPSRPSHPEEFFTFNEVQPCLLLPLLSVLQRYQFTISLGVARISGMFWGASGMVTSQSKWRSSCP